MDKILKGEEQGRKENKKQGRPYVGQQQAGWNVN